MNVDIAKRLADRRRHAGLTQEALAEKLDVSRQAVSKWERSESSPDTDNLIALAELYGVSLDELLFGSVEDEADAVATVDEVFVEDAAEPDQSTERETESAAEADTKPETESATDSDSEAHSYSSAEASQNSSESFRGGFGFNSPDGKVHIGPDGIRVEDGKDHVNINWQDGVNVYDGKKGDQVHVGWDGIRINGQHYDDTKSATAAMCGHPYKAKEAGFAHAWTCFPFPAIVLIAYLFIGFATDQWGIGAFIFATIPLYYLLGALITTKRLGPFLTGTYAVAALCWFCYMAFVQGEPHPAWVIFLTIPLVAGCLAALSHWWDKSKRRCDQC